MVRLGLSGDDPLRDSGDEDDKFGEAHPHHLGRVPHRVDLAHQALDIDILDVGHFDVSLVQHHQALLQRDVLGLGVAVEKFLQDFLIFL